MLGETENSSDVCRTASLSEMGHDRNGQVTPSDSLLLFLGTVYKYTYLLTYLLIIPIFYNSAFFASSSWLRCFTL